MCRSIPCVEEADNQKSKKQRSLQNDSQAREWVKPPHMIIESKIGVVCFQPSITLQL